MKLAAGIAVVKGIRLAIALPHPSYVRPGVGDVLLERIAPHFPTLPVMLVSDKASNARAYATFETDALLAELDLSTVELDEIDLDTPPMVQDEPPF